jgi:hypothetical protein
MGQRSKDRLSEEALEVEARFTGPSAVNDHLTDRKAGANQVVEWDTFGDYVAAKVAGVELRPNDAGKGGNDLQLDESHIPAHFRVSRPMACS